MKRYLVSVAVEVNEKASKTGVKYQFWGRIDNPEKFIRENEKHFDNGLRIKDSKTGEIIYQSWSRLDSHGTLNQRGLNHGKLHKRPEEFQVLWAKAQQEH